MFLIAEQTATYSVTTLIPQTFAVAFSEVCCD